jgi:AcrR family transcriptional regulator
MKARKDTSALLIESGIVLFGARGYDGVTTRELAHGAHTNISSIKYHFGGKEELYRAVKVQTQVVMQRPDTYQVSIELPSEKITAGLAEDLSARIKRYCQFQAEQSRQDLQMLRHQGVDSLWTSVFVLVPCLVLGVLCTWLSRSGINDLLQAVFFVVAMAFALGAGWVALWMPAETFLYDTWPFQQDRRVYQQIADATIVISER